MIAVVVVVAVMMVVLVIVEVVVVVLRVVLWLHNHLNRLVYSQPVHSHILDTEFDTVVVVEVLLVVNWNVLVKLVVDETSVCPMFLKVKRFHFDMVILMNTADDMHWHCSLEILNSSSQHPQLDTEDIEEYTEMHQHYLMFYCTCHLEYQNK
jgi:hypothetical protein